MENQNFDIQKALLLPLNSRGELFIQDRRGHKYPDWGYWGGSIETGETPLEAVIRETKEELNLNLKEEDLRYLGPSVTNWNGTKIIRYLYLYRTDQVEFEIHEGKGGEWLNFSDVLARLEPEDKFNEISNLIREIDGSNEN